MMRRGLVLLVVLLLLAGCTRPQADPTPSTTTPTPEATAAPTVATSATSPPPPATPSLGAPPPPGALEAGPASAEGTPYDAVLWEEPAPPRADLLSVRVSSGWSLRVTGAPGAVAPNARILVESLGVARGALSRAQADGSFAVDLAGAEGAWVRVVTLPETLAPAPDLVNQVTKVEHLRPSTYVRAPATTPAGLSPADRSVWAASEVPGGPAWRFSGGVQDLGASVRVHGVLRAQTTADISMLAATARLSRVFDAQGEPLPELGVDSTSYLTPSGLPLERLTQQPTPARVDRECTPTREDASTLRCDIDLDIPASGLPVGGYVVRLHVPNTGISSPPPPDKMATNGRAYDPVEGGAALTLLARGTSTPFHLATMLLVDAPAQAARGVQSEDARWGWSAGIAQQPSLHVTPRTDATGAPIRYTLDAYAPQVLSGDRETPAPPFFPLALPDGNWTIDIVDPDGGTQTLGPSPIRQLSSRTASTTTFEPVSNGGYNVDGVARLVTDLAPHAFTKDGLHSLKTHGDVRDADGNRFRLDGTFQVLVAQPLDLDLGMLPFTPLPTGAALDRAIQVHPPVPAEISFRFREWSAADGKLVIDDTTTGKASAFGWFHPHPGHPVSPTVGGEYRIDVYANHTDAQGRLWSAAVTFGGVVVDPAQAIDVHGRRGIDLAHQDLARYTRAQTGAPIGGNHMDFPYYAGDVAWQADDDAMNVMITVADPTDRFAHLLRERVTQASFLYADSIAEVENQQPTHGEDVATPGFARGQGPLFSTTSTGRDASLGDPLTRQAYAYMAVEKPGVRVRETIREDAYKRPYWRFGEPYQMQPGMGPQGDEPNDYKFLFGGAVFRDAASGIALTGGYSSFWIDLPVGGASRIDSPFAAGAPPLFTVDGRAVRAFYDPTGTRPGSLLETGDMADFGGYIVPLGPQHVFLNVTSPSGQVRTLAGAADAWGFLHDPAMNFEVDEAGVWSVDVHVVACPPTRDAGLACREGGLDDGRSSYDFYVGTKGAPSVPMKLPRFAHESRPLVVSVKNVTGAAHQTAWMPGWRIDDREVAPGSPLFAYDLASAARRLPNVDRERFTAQGIGPGPSDQVTFTAIVPMPDGTWRGAAFDLWGTRVLG